MAATGSSHDELHDLASLYIVGALPHDQREAFERHMASCAECSAEIEALRPVADLLAHAVPVHTPASDLRAQVLAAATSTQEPLPFTPKPIAASTSRTASLLPWLLAAASMLLTAGLGAYVSQLRGEIDVLTRELRAANDAAAGTQRELVAVRRTAAQAQSMAAVFSAPDVTRVDLAGQPQALSATGRAFVSQSRGVIFAASNLPPLRPGRAYQLWVVPAAGVGAAIGAGVMRPDANGQVSGVHVLDPTTPQAVAIALTEEPEAGSPLPTSAPVLVGAVRTL